MKAVTHKGLEVDLLFHEQDPHDQKGQDDGWVCHRIEALVDGQVIGYLKIEYVPSKTFSEKVPSIWHWWSPTRGRADDLAEVWYLAHFHLGVIPKSLQGRITRYLALSRKEHTPTEDVILADLKALEKQVKGRGIKDPWSEFEAFKRNHMDRPKVGYIYTQFPSSLKVRIAKMNGEPVPGPDWRRKGVATLLYTEGAKWLAREKGLPLWASTLQQDCATSTWTYLMTSGHYPVRKEPCPWDSGKQVPLLDYTGV